MKRSALIKHLKRQGCELLREGSRHTVFVNPANRRTSTVPRHVKIADLLARKICHDPEIPMP
jgi:predicted RNA binding protein YcfA (HicA-like mRNA interferase family)